MANPNSQLIPSLHEQGASARFRGENPLLLALAARRAARVEAALADLRRGDVAKLVRLPQGSAVDPYELATLLRELVPPQELRRRLECLGFAETWLTGQLAAVSLCGAGIALRLGKQGRLRTGPGVDRALLQAFPELLPLTLRNMPDLTIVPGQGAGQLHFDHPTTSGTRATYWNLAAVPRTASIDSATAYYQLGGSGLNSPSISDPFGGPVGYDGVIAWNTAGLQWIKEQAGATNASPGDMQLSIQYSDPGSGSLDQIRLEISYSEPEITLDPCPNREGYLELGQGGSDACGENPPPVPGPVPPAPPPGPEEPSPDECPAPEAGEV
jgi:hypothetical protein